MPSTGVNHGDIFSLTIAGTAVTHSTSHSFSYDTDTIETTSKDSSQQKSFIPSDQSWSCSGEAFFAEDAAYTFTDLYALKGTIVACVYTSGVTGDNQYTGNGILTNISRTSGHGEAETISYSIQGTGAWTESAVS
jgi:TP901-1 family phage major tail protein